MVDDYDKIEYTPLGIGSALAQHRLTVPLNQREYSWEQEHVVDLLEDLHGAIDNGRQTYFLGTIVLTRAGDTLEIADGQQRLATTTIFLVALRDYWARSGSPKRAISIENKFLSEIDAATERSEPHLTLNVDDRDFFRNAIVADEGSPAREIVPTLPSHERLKMAYQTCAEYITKLLEPVSVEARDKVLVGWLEFIRDKAKVVVLTVPDHMNAFQMFETLNDRGLKAGQVDLLKSYLLGLTKHKIAEAQQKWAQMLGSLEASNDDNEVVMDFLKYVAICQSGNMRDRELYERIKASINSEAKALDFLAALPQLATRHAAMFNPEHAFWNDAGGDTARGAIRTFTTLRLKQIRPLIFAVMLRFEGKELSRAFSLFVAWSVRFLVAGGGRGGALDKLYSRLATEVYHGRITSAKGLADAANGVIPSDARFEYAFATATVAKGYLGKYYLRALELKVGQDPEPEFVPNQDDVINTEHIIPKTLGTGWGHIPAKQADALSSRLGNQVLLKAKRNVKIGNLPFTEKVEEFKLSGYMLTREVAKETEWGEDQINARQERLAKLAVQTWPIRP